MDYEKLVKSFGSSLITEDIVARVERVTGRKAHRFLRRGLFFSHRDLTQVSQAPSCLLADQTLRFFYKGLTYVNHALLFFVRWRTQTLEAFPPQFDAV